MAVCSFLTAAPEIASGQSEPGACRTNVTRLKASPLFGGDGKGAEQAGGTKPPWTEGRAVNEGPRVDPACRAKSAQEARVCPGSPGTRHPSLVAALKHDAVGMADRGGGFAATGALACAANAKYRDHKKEGESEEFHRGNSEAK